MKTYLSIPIIALTALVTIGPMAQAHGRRWHRDCDVRTSYVIRDRDYRIVEREDPWIVRAGRTVVRTPVIIGETIAGRRHIVRPAPIAERVDRRYYRYDYDDVDMFRADGRTLLGRGPGDDLELFGD